jgi:anti-sigma B factor antagonist
VSEIQSSSFADGLALSTSIERRDGEVMIFVGGEIDVANSQRLREVIEPCIAVRTPLIIDLADVAFIDSSGLKILLWAQDAMEGHDAILMLKNPSTSVIALLAATGLDSMFHVTTDVRHDLPAVPVRLPR